MCLLVWLPLWLAAEKKTNMFSPAVLPYLLPLRDTLASNRNCMDKDFYCFLACTLVWTRCYPETQVSVLFNIKSQNILCVNSFLLYQTQI